MTAPVRAPGVSLDAFRAWEAGLARPRRPTALSAILARLRAAIRRTRA